MVLSEGRIEERPHGRCAYGCPLTLALGCPCHPKASQLENFGSNGRATRLARIRTISHLQPHVRH